MKKEYINPKSVVVRLNPKSRTLTAGDTQEGVQWHSEVGDTGGAAKRYSGENLWDEDEADEDETPTKMPKPINVWE